MKLHCDYRKFIKLSQVLLWMSLNGLKTNESRMVSNIIHGDVNFWASFWNCLNAWFVMQNEQILPKLSSSKHPCCKYLFQIIFVYIIIGIKGILASIDWSDWFAISLALSLESRIIGRAKRISFPFLIV